MEEEDICPGGAQGERVIGNYILGRRIGFGSFAVVWKSRHRQTGLQVAVKEIDKMHLLTTATNANSNNNTDNSYLLLLNKEISILSNIRHPNIIRLFEAIQTEDRIYLVLEYCDGGDLAAYIHRRGKVSEAVARHFMRQLAGGLQVLYENHLIHRDLKPQNLFLSNNEGTPVLKIGDFGFARYLTPQGLADTLCGSPLYMAPEIIRNKQYDAKADLWSAGAILFQLVTGRPPFDGDSHLQLFQNILTSSELQFPQGALNELHLDCVDLCRRLLRQNPVERLTFEEFFNHRFLTESGKSKPYSSVHGDNKEISFGQDNDNTSSNKIVQIFVQNVEQERPRTSLDDRTYLSNELRVADFMESIEKEYVVVDAHFSSTEIFSDSLEASLLNDSTSKVVGGPSSSNNRDILTGKRMKDTPANSVGKEKTLSSHDSASAAISSTSAVLKEVQRLPILHPSTRLQLLHQYINILSEIAQIKFGAGFLLESFSVELVVLALWKEALQVCSSWLASPEGGLQGSSSAEASSHSDEGVSLSTNSGGDIDFSSSQSASIWAKQGFIVAFDRTEKLSNHVQAMDGNAQMPDAMEVIFQTALEVGKSGGVDELMGNKENAAAAYSKAKLLLFFYCGRSSITAIEPTICFSSC